MRYWGKNIEIDGSYYATPMGKSFLPTATEMLQLKATGNYFQHEGNIKFYEETVQNMMREISSNQIGKILIEALNKSPRKLRIIPLTGKEMFQKGQIPCARLVGTPDAGGNDCVIWFEPWSRMLSLFSGIGNSPYQVLVHELHHALRQMRGKWNSANSVLQSPFTGFPNPEELFSVTFENIYLSSAGQPQRMIGAYNAIVPLGSRTDRDWYKQYVNELDFWCRDLPDLAVQIERITGIWNPIHIRRAVFDLIISPFNL